MRPEFAPSTIVRTSEFIGFSGLRVIIRQWPSDGVDGSGSKGLSSFMMGYRPMEERGRTFIRFRDKTGPVVQMSRVSAVVPPDRPFEASYTDAAGKIATFEIEPRFLEHVIHRAGLAPLKLDRMPPARFLINRRVDYLCSLLMYETERKAQLAPLYFENLATALVTAVVSQTDCRMPAMFMSKTSVSKKRSRTLKQIFNPN
jgi:hypothetical protein